MHAIFPSKMRRNALDNAYPHNESKNSERCHEKRDVYGANLGCGSCGPNASRFCRRTLECVHAVRFPKHGVGSEEIVKYYITSEFLTASLSSIAAIFPSEMRGNASYNAYLQNESKKSGIFDEKRDTYVLRVWC